MPARDPGFHACQAGAAFTGRSGLGRMDAVGPGMSSELNQLMWVSKPTLAGD
jgi:hypothetical protein